MSNETNLTLTDPLNDIRNIRPVFQALIITTTIITAIITLFAIFIIWRKSTFEMRKYKLFLINILVTSFFLQMTIFLWMPIPIFNILGGLCIGYLRLLKIPDFILNYICLDIFIGLVINLLLAYFNFLLYQVLAMKIGPLLRIFATKKACFSYYFASFLVFYFVALIPLSFSYTSEEVFSQIALEKFPYLQAIFGKERVFGFDSTRADFLWVFVYILLALLLIYFISGLFLNYLAIKGIYKLKSLVTPKIFHLQKTLYICVLLQTIFSFTFFFVPPIFIFLANLFDTNVVLSRGMITVIIISFHGPCCSLIMIFTIRPYRHYAKQIFSYITCKKLISVMSTQTHTNTWTL